MINHPIVHMINHMSKYHYTLDQYVPKKDESQSSQHIYTNNMFYLYEIIICESVHGMK